MAKADWVRDVLCFRQMDDNKAVLSSNTCITGIVVITGQ